MILAMPFRFLSHVCFQGEEYSDREVLDIGAVRECPDWHFENAKRGSKWRSAPGSIRKHAFEAKSLLLKVGII